MGLENDEKMYKVYFILNFILITCANVVLCRCLQRSEVLIPWIWSYRLL